MCLPIRFLGDISDFLNLDTVQDLGMVCQRWKKELSAVTDLNHRMVKRAWTKLEVSKGTSSYLLFNKPFSLTENYVVERVIQEGDDVFYFVLWNLV